MVFNHRYSLIGIPKRVVLEKIQPWADMENPKVSVQSERGEIYINLQISCNKQDDENDIFRKFNKFAEEEFGQYIYGIDKPNLETVVVDLLNENRLVLATAESCTAGLVSKRITDVSGSSSVFHCGVAAYSNDIKCDVLKVNPLTIKKHGVVSSQVASAMALGALKISKGNLGIGITGVAGPNSDDEGNPVGLVYIALTDGVKVWVKRLKPNKQNFDREYVRFLSSSHALDLVRQYITMGRDKLSGGVLVDDDSEFSKDIALVDENAPQSDENNHSVDNVASIALAKALSDMKGEPEQVDDYYETNEEYDEDGNQEPGDYEGEEENITYDEDGNPIKSKKEKLPFKQRICKMVKSFIPWKGDTTPEIVRKCILIVCVITFLVCAGYLINELVISPRNADELVNKLENLPNVKEDNIDYPDGILTKFIGLYNSNQETAGWVKIEGTDVNLPVVKSADNDKYLHKNFFGNDDKNGTIFMDYRCDIKDCKNTILYGHSMKTGKMFGSLLNYERLQYYKDHPLIQYDSLFKEGKWKIFAVFYASTLPEDEPNFYYIRPSFDDNEDFMSFVDQIKKRSLFNTTVDVQQDDQMLMLSTCAYNFKESRMVVVARRVRDGEDETVDVSNAIVNDNCRMPDVWYKNKGLPVPEDEETSTLPEVSPEETNQESEESIESAIQETSKLVLESRPVLKEPVEDEYPDVKNPTDDHTQPLPDPPKPEESGWEPVESSEDSSNADSSGELSTENEKITVTQNYNGEKKKMEISVLDFLTGVVSYEMGSDYFTAPAQQAQAIASYSYYSYYRASTAYPDIWFITEDQANPRIWNRVRDNIKSVAGKKMMLDKKPLLAFYYAASCGVTANCNETFVEDIPYLHSVESPGDKDSFHYGSYKSVDSTTVRRALEKELGITMPLDKSSWMINTVDPSNPTYVVNMPIDGNSGKSLKGTKIRSMFGLKSHSFYVSYDMNTDSFIFTTWGYGHGVGMSQIGANWYAASKGYDYESILRHYYGDGKVKFTIE